MASAPQGFEAFFYALMNWAILKTMTLMRTTPSRQFALGSNFVPEEREMNHAFISRRHYSWRHVVSFRIRPACPR